MTIFVLMRVKLLLAGFVLDFTSASCAHILGVCRGFEEEFWLRCQVLY